VRSEDGQLGSVGQRGPSANSGHQSVEDRLALLIVLIAWSPSESKCTNQSLLIVSLVARKVLYCSPTVISPVYSSVVPIGQLKKTA